jgi:hypothetical protein
VGHRILSSKEHSVCRRGGEKSTYYAQSSQPVCEWYTVIDALYFSNGLRDEATDPGFHSWQMLE